MQPAPANENFSGHIVRQRGAEEKHSISRFLSRSQSTEGASGLNRL